MGNVGGAYEGMQDVALCFVLLIGCCPLRVFQPWICTSVEFIDDVIIDVQLLGNHYRAEFSNRAGLTEEKVDEFVESYLREKKGGKGPGGWPGAYCVSKMALNGYMSVLARELIDRKIHVNSFSPGYTRTGMTGGQGTNSAAEGAMTAVWLALHPPNDYPYGKFWGEKCRGEMSF